MRVLVSVRSHAEAASVASLGLGIIDLKEPNSGSLGPTDTELWTACSREISTTSRWSVALGDGFASVNGAASVPRGIHFAKAGPAGITAEDSLKSLWKEISQALPDSTHQVAVAYADAESANCLEVRRIIDLAAAHGLRYLLIDTFAKNGQSTLQQIPKNLLRRQIEMAQQNGMQVVLAGSLKFAHLADFIDSKADFIGVRGCVCSGSRRSDLDQKKVIGLLQTLDSQTNRAVAD